MLNLSNASHIHAGTHAPWHRHNHQPINTYTQKKLLWLWPKHPPLAFSVAEISVAEMSWPKCPWPKCPWSKYPTFQSGTPLKVFFLCFVLESPFVDTLPTTHQKTFIFDHFVPCTVGFDTSTPSDMRAHASGLG